MGRTILAHEIYLLSVNVPTGETGAGKDVGAFLIVANEVRPRLVVGRRYFIS